MKLKQIVLTACFGMLLTGSAHAAGIMSFLLRHDSTITAGLAGYIAASIVPPEVIKGQKTMAINLLLAGHMPGKSILIEAAIRIAAGITAYKLVKYLLTPTPQNNNQR